MPIQNDDIRIATIERDVCNLQANIYAKIEDIDVKIEQSEFRQQAYIERAIHRNEIEIVRGMVKECLREMFDSIRTSGRSLYDVDLAEFEQIVFGGTYE